MKLVLVQLSNCGEKQVEVTIDDHRIRRQRKHDWRGYQHLYRSDDGELNRAAGVSGDFSFDLTFVLPVAFRSFTILRSRRIDAYVSQRK